MSAGRFLTACLILLAAATSATEASAHRRGLATRATHLGPFVEQAWQEEDWAHAPAVRDWGFSAPWDFDPATLYPSSTEQYPWGYTTAFVRVGHKCVASEINGSPGGDWVRYQRVMPAYYCRR